MVSRHSFVSLFGHKIVESIPFICRHKESFIRKGCTRDWKNHMSREQSDRMDALFKQRMAGTRAENWWRDEMRWEDEESMDEDSGMESADETISNSSSDSSADSSRRSSFASSAGK